MHLEYDEKKLNDFTVKQLAVQVIARLDLFFPKHEANIAFGKARAEAKHELNNILEDVEAVGIPDLTEVISDIIEKYFGVI